MTTTLAGTTKAVRKAPMGKIADLRKFRRLWDANLSTSEIADQLGVQDSVVRATARRHGFPARDTLAIGKATRARNMELARKRQAARAKEAAKRPATLTEKLVATRGNYDKLRALAKRHDWTHATMMQRYHAARASLPGGGVI
ncbi:hypothetical protein [Yoonia sp. 208BN28-4]|uniref:hypothetical protein n=1 Tax=Yoonia sp. 208BN28-4 TaxID=3126505 RepID=UPI0030952465